ncbi:MAG TPA: sugar phosphate nucleotidyltransferase [Candidatus Binatia bacterium]|nr:sugar phosphate nucleotidyltransferase [Candidatus Binatia bacterium]
MNRNNPSKANIYSVIIAGGRGTRFWPLSRAQRPKQLLKIFSRKSLIRETADRIMPLSGRNQTLVVTVAEQLNAVRKELASLPRENFLSEPYGNNTAPCIGLAALEIVTHDPDAVMIVLPADHWVADSAAFRATLKAAVALAVRHRELITIGVRPEYPETGYGYIVKGEKVDGHGTGSAYRVKRFKEKPTSAMATKLIRQGSLWNSGIFVWKASALLDLLERYQPSISGALQRIKGAAKGKPLASPAAGLRAAIARAYATMPSISIDHGVLEKAGSEGRVLTLKADFGWSDIGSWAAVHRMMRRDTNGNAANGKWLGLGAKDCLIHSQDRLVVLLAVHNTVIIDTADALLVGDLKRSQEVRELVAELKKKGYGSYTVK